MIAGLKGVVFKKDKTKVLFDVNGVIYEVLMPLNAIANIKQEDIIFTTHIIREDSSLLFGFLEDSQKELFDNLIKVSGIGPKVALSICSYFDVSELISIINSSDFAKLKKIPGIGEKNAKRIIIELNGKLDNISINHLSAIKQDALFALESLGFKQNEVMELLKSSSLNTTKDIIKEVLGKINK